MHAAPSVLAPSKASFALRCVTAGNLQFDASANFAAASRYQDARAHQVFRYFDGQAFFDDPGLNMLTAALRDESPFFRRRFFETVSACRRRAALDDLVRPRVLFCCYVLLAGTSINGTNKGCLSWSFSPRSQERSCFTDYNLIQCVKPERHVNGRIKIKSFRGTPRKDNDHLFQTHS